MTKLAIYVAIGALLIAYLLYYMHRVNSDSPYWPDGNWYTDPQTTINRLDNV